jgi:hypothetical protein
LFTSHSLEQHLQMHYVSGKCWLHSVDEAKRSTFYMIVYFRKLQPNSFLIQNSVTHPQALILPPSCMITTQC